MSEDETDNPGNAPTPETHQGSSGPPADRGGESAHRSPPESRSGAAEPRGRAGTEGESPPERKSESADETTPRAEIDRVQGGIEAILLAADRPVPRDELLETYGEVPPSLVDRALERIELEFSGGGRGIHLQRVAGGYQLRTNPAFSDAVREHVEANPVSLSRAAVETLAIVAYRQPVTRAEIEEIRGVDSSGVLRTLTDYDMVRVVGRLDDLGRPHVYGTTDRFLEVFGLEDLTDLPTLSEDEHEALEELYEDEMDRFDEEFE